MKKNTTKIAIIVMAATTLSRFAGFIRDIIMGSVLGTSYIADAYHVSVSVPNLLFITIAGAVGTTFIPIYVSTKEKYDNQKSINFTNNVLNIVLLISILLAFVSVIFSRQILSLIAYGFDDKKMSAAVDISNIVFFTAIFIGINAVLTSYLNSNDKFVLTSIIGVPYSIIIIASLLLYNKLGIQGVAYATLIGMASQTVLLCIRAFLVGFRFKPFIDIKDRALRDMLALSIPVFIGGSVIQIDSMVDRMLASGLTEGSISALNYANKLISFVFSITSAAIGTVIYPLLSKFSATKDDISFKNLLVKSLNTIAILLLPITVAACILNEHIVKMLFERGAFNAESTALTASSLLYYSIGLVFIGYRDILSRVFYSIHDTKTPMINGVIALIMNVVLNIILVRFMEHRGLALATSITSAITTVLLFYSLRKKMGSIGGRQLLIAFIKSAFAAAVMGFVVFYTYKLGSVIFSGHGLLSDVIAFGILVIEGALVYFILMLILRTNELMWFLQMVQKASKKYF